MTLIKAIWASLSAAITLLGCLPDTSQAASIWDRTYNIYVETVDPTTNKTLSVTYQAPMSYDNYHNGYWGVWGTAENVVAYWDGEVIPLLRVDGGGAGWDSTSGLSGFGYYGSYAPDTRSVVLFGWSASLLTLTINGPGDVQFGGVVTKWTMDPMPSVPEPATWAMMILGLAAVGSALRKHKGYALS